MLKFDEQKQLDSVNGALALRGRIEEIVDAICAEGYKNICWLGIGDTVEIPEGARQDVTYVKVNCTEIATSLGNPKGANIVMTGAIIKLMGDFTHDAAVAAMNHMFAKKGKSKFNESNARAFDAGFNAV